MNNIYCVCTTPETYYGYINHWHNFPNNQNLFWLNDITRNATNDIGITYSESDLRKKLNFYSDVSKKHYWNSYGNRNIIWFYAHFRMLYFYLIFPDYDNYWFFDDDIKVKNWSLFFDGFEKVDSDFISYFCFKKDKDLLQPDIPIIDDKTFSKDLWFERFPGDGDIMPNNIKNYYGSFFPIIRFSKNAFEILLKTHLNGFYGYSEGFVPTILNDNNCKLNTIFKPDNNSNFFDVDKVDIQHKNTKINWEWI